MRISAMDEEKAREWERCTTFMVEAEGRFAVCEMKKVVEFYETLTDDEQTRFDNEVAGRCEARVRMLYSRRSKRRPLIQSDVGMADFDDVSWERIKEEEDYNDEDDEFLHDFEKALRVSRVTRQAQIDMGLRSPNVARPPSPPPPPPPPLLMVSCNPCYSRTENGESSTRSEEIGCDDGSENVQKKEKPKKPKRKSKA